MIRRRTLIASMTTALVALMMSVGAQPAAAQTAGCSPIDRGGTECRIGDNPPAPTPGSPTVTSASPSGPVFVPLNLSFDCDAAGGSGWSPVDDVAAAIFDISILAGGSPAADPGELWIAELIDPVTGPTNTGYINCVGLGDPAPQPPPAFPTANEIWEAALTFQPEVNLDPYIRGLTGLETFVWYEGPTSDTVVLSLNGYSVTGQVSAVEFGWDMGGESRDGDQYYRSAVPGSPDDPAAAHTYAQPADLLIVHETLWTGSAVITGPGIPAGGVTVDLGQAILAVARQYAVIEVRTPVIPG